MPMSISSDPEPGLVADQFPVFLRRAVLSGAPEVFREFFQFSPFVGEKVRLDGEQIPGSGSRRMRVRTSVAPAVKRKFTSSSVIRSIRFLS